MPKEVTKKEHEASMDIIIRPLIVINLDEDNMNKIDDEVNNELNTLFSSSMNLDNDFAMKSGELGDNPSLALAIVYLASFLSLAYYTNQDWEEDEFLEG
jgi:hypothetical protein